MTALVPMTDSEYLAYVAEAIPSYAADKVASGQWSPQESLERSRKALDELLPQGRTTPDNHLFTIVDQNAVAVGLLWIAVQERAGKRIAFVCDVSVKPEHQRKGHATRAFEALEGTVRSLGLSGIALHVFGHNTSARALYGKLGFIATNISMFRSLERDDG